MIQFRVLGSLGLVGPEGNEILTVLFRPKHTAVLAYLALASPQGFHRRDKIAALFWPEDDHEHARASLRGTVHFLRRSLGKDVVLSRGKAEIGLDWGHVTCDAVEFQEAVERGDVAGALDLYRGDLLEGFFLSGCPEFDQWLDGERERFRELAAAAAWATAHQYLRVGRITSAERTGQKARSLVATDENEVRRFILALAEAGDRAAAVRFYERFAQILQDTLELEPSAETRALVRAIRSPALVAGSGTAEALRESTRRPQEREGITEEIRAPEVLTPAKGPSAARLLRLFVGTAGVGVAVLTALAVGYLLTSGGPDSDAELRENRVAVMPFENRTGREDWAMLGEIVADVLAEGLVQTGMVEVFPTSVTIPFAREARPEGSEALTEGGVWALATEARAGIVIRGAYYVLGDSLRIQGELCDEKTRSVMGSHQVTRLAAKPMDAVGEMRQRLLTELALRFDPRVVEELGVYFGSRLPRYDAYEAYMQAGEATVLRHQDNEAIVRHALRAFELDSTFFIALDRAAYGFYSLGQLRQADSVLDIMESHEDELDRGARNGLRCMRARVHGDLETEYRCVRDWFGQGASYGQGLWTVGWAALRVNRPREALDQLLRADPDCYTLREEPGYWTSLTEAYHLLDRPEEELAAARRGRERFPCSPETLRNELVALAALGQVQRALAGVDQLGGLSTGSPAPNLQILARELRAHGHSEAAREVLRHLLAWFRTQAPSRLETQTSRLELGLTHYLLNDLDEAEAILRGIEREEATGERTEEVRRLVWAPGLLGVVAARRGHRAEALRRSRDLADVDLPYLNGLNTLWRGRIAAELGDREKAMDYLLEAHVQGQPFGWSWHRDEMLELLRDHLTFQRFMRPKG